MSEIADSFASSLSELTVNSKPHINMLTMLAEDHLEFAPIITQTVLSHLQKVRPEVKLPVLYLIDSIVKNVGKAYVNLFTQSIVQSFTNTFEKVDEKTREQMFKLRQTWSEVFPTKTMFTLDAKVHQIDPAWPVSTPPSTVHLNPKFFKSDILDPKSLTSTIKQPEMAKIESRSHHRKNKTYSSRSDRVSHSSRSKKASPTSSASVETAPGTKPTPTPEQLREQMIVKQKMLLELQQQKLKLELLQTQAQLEEQQKQLEQKHKSSPELTKLQQQVSQEEAKLKAMSRDLKKQTAMKFPKLQQLHRVTTSMKAQKLTDISKITSVPESLVKPFALAELTNEDINVKPSKPVVKPSASKETKLKSSQLPQVIERQKQVAPADSTEEVSPPVRIAPVSSQLIQAAVTFGRNVRDPRIRQMSSRLESQMNNAVTQTPAPVAAAPVITTVTAPLKKPEATVHIKSPDKNRKDKKSSSNHHKERSVKSSEEETKSHNRAASRSSDRLSNKSMSKTEKSSSSKRPDDRSSKRSKVEDLFSALPRSKSPLQTQSNFNSHSPSKSVSKREHTNHAEKTENPSKTFSDKNESVESIPKRSKLQDNLHETQTVVRNNESELVKQALKLTVDTAKAHIMNKTDPPKSRISPEPMDSSAEMNDEDIEKIVKHPGITSKISKPPEIAPYPEASEDLKSSDDSAEEKFDDIIKHPSKQLKFDKLGKTNVDQSKRLAAIFDLPVKEEQDQTGFISTNLNPERIVNEPELSVDAIDSTVSQNNLEDSKKELNSLDALSFPKPNESIDKIPQSISSNKNKENMLSIEVHSNDDKCKATDFNQSFQEESNKESEMPIQKLEQEEVTSTVNAAVDMQTNVFESYGSPKETTDNSFKDHTTSGNDKYSNDMLSESEKPVAEMVYSFVQSNTQETLVDSTVFSKGSEMINLSPLKVQSPNRTVEPMETIVETNENEPSELLSPRKSERRSDSPVHQEKKRKGDKPSIMEQIITDAENHEESPSPPPPPVISDKFKEIKQSSLNRLRRVCRSREDLADSESPEPADVDLRTQIHPPQILTKDLKNEVLGLAEKDVDLRNLPVSPTKKRPSMEKLLDIPPAKKSKAEVMDELFGSEDVDLRPVLCPPPPSPPPPPVISSSPPPDDVGERSWARYKQTKPDTYKVKYTPSRRDRTPSIDKFGRNQRLISTEGRGGWQGRNRMYQEDVDMRAQPPGASEGTYNQIITQAMEQHKRGDLNDEAYKRVLSEVMAMKEKQKLEEAQRRDEEAQAEHLDPISDEEISEGGSLTGVEDAPSPTDSYSGGEEVDDMSLKNNQSTAEKQRFSTDELLTKASDKLEDVDIREPYTNVDIRLKIHPSQADVNEKQKEQEKSSRKLRGESPYSRRSESDKERYRRRKEELRAQRREKRSRRNEEERGSNYRKSRFSEEEWKEKSSPPSESIETETPRVPPLTHYEDDHGFRELPPTVHPPRDFPLDQHDSPNVRPIPWETPRIPGPWMSGLPPVLRGPSVMGIRAPQDRYMPPRWRQPGPGLMFEGDHGPRFNRFGPPPLGRFPVPLAPCEVPPTDPLVLKAIEEDPTKSINIDGIPRDIRFYGMTAVALMSWDDPREVTFQPGQHRRVIIDDREPKVVYFNAPPVEIIVDGKPHRMRFGAPTRELYIGNQWFEIFFGGPPVTCNIAGQPHTIQLEGPPPPVRPGIQRKDLVVGKITLIIDAEYFFPVYLDAKPQKFEVKGVSYIIRFVEALQKTVINGVPFKSDFGGLPRPIILNGSKHFFRLTELPRGITPGYLTLAQMEGGRLQSPPLLPAPPQLPASLEQAVDMKGDPFLQPPMGLMTVPPRVSPEVTNREVEPAAILHPPVLPPVSTAPPQAVTLPAAMVNPLDVLSTLLPAPEPSRATGDYSYSVDNESSNQGAPTSSSSVATTTGPAAIFTGEINVTELLQKLMATGIVPSAVSQPKDKSQDKPVTTDARLIVPVDFRKPETLKVRQTALISSLYSGIQCNSCGVRFPPEQTMKYSQHLDWHFRQNRRDKDSTRTAQTRRYYYDVNDWVQFEEIEDLEERAQPWFDMQEGRLEEEEAPRAVVSVHAAHYPEDAACHICHDKFESFYNEEKEEWHLRNAADQDGNLVHPICLEDQRAAAEKPIVVDDIDITEDEPTGEESKEVTEEKKDVELTKEGPEEDDDIMEVTDIEFIKPDFPVEDLTVSDNEEEKPTDNINEEKPEVAEDSEQKKDVEELEVTDIAEVDIEKKEGDESVEETKLEKTEAETKDEDTQDDLVVIDEKGEDSVLSNVEIMEVVRNIKKDPDALGGEFEEIGLDPDVEIKKEKGEVPLPEPVVDTTHATVTCLIDGNVEFDETPQQMTAGGPPKIKINITKPNVLVTKEQKEDDSEALDNDMTNPPLSYQSLVNQPPPPGEEPIPQYVKPRLIGKKMQELPPVLKGNEMSGLCSIM